VGFGLWFAVSLLQLAGGLQDSLHKQEKKQCKPGCNLAVGLHLAY
jgi:hypothetical protein